MTERSATDGTPAPEEVEILAPAKVNLVLKILDRRPDGYHNLWSLMHTVGVEDHLRIRRTADTKAIRFTSDHPSLPTDARNLIVKAAALVVERAGYGGGLHIEMSKQIPMGAGLGGGSSDAAATIVGLNDLLRLGWSRAEMAELGLALGSDVPFFFAAPSAIVEGRGETVVPTRVMGQRWVVLVRPEFAVETKWAYERLACMRTHSLPLSPPLKDLSSREALSWDHVIPLMENDFEEVLAASHGVVRELKQELLARGAEGALLSGSGSTVFGLFRSEHDAGHAQEFIRAARGYWAVAGRTATAPLSSLPSST